MAHVLGFTNIDDRGQEGLELAFDEWLRGKPGAKRVIRNRKGETVESDLLRAAEPGKDLTLSIDRASSTWPSRNCATRWWPTRRPAVRW